MNSSALELINGVLGIADWLCVAVIIFSGCIWMFGQRSKAIEHLLGGASGYILIRKATAIQEWLKAITK